MISIATDDLFKRFGADRALEMISRAGFDAIDYDMSFSTPVWENPCRWETMKESDLDEHKEAMKKYGLACGQVHALYPIYSPDEAVQERIIAALKRQIAFCRYLECDKLVIHPGARKYKEQMSTEEARAYNFGIFSALIPELKRYRVTACIENIYQAERGKIFEDFFTDVRTINSFLDELNELAGGTCFAFNLDTGHALLVSRDIGEMVRGVGPRLASLHMNDNDGVDDWHQLPFAGKLDWNRLFGALRDIGYRGNMNFELTLGVIPDSVMPAALQFIAEAGREAQRVVDGRL